VERLADQALAAATQLGCMVTGLRATYPKIHHR
jgi:hypothetical protein